MKQLLILTFLLLHLVPEASAEAKVMNPGETHGQLVFLNKQDVLDQTPKYQSLSPISIPVFAEMPFNLSVVAGAITLLEQGFLSHVQIKARARKIPNLDISGLAGGMNNPMFSGFQDGDFIHLILDENGGVQVSASSEGDAIAYYKAKKSQSAKIELSADIFQKSLFEMNEIGWEDFVAIGSKGANYAELAHALNSAERVVVRPSLAVPFYYYQQFVESNSNLKQAVTRLLRDPLMKKVSASRYREEKLLEVRELILSGETSVDENFLLSLLSMLDQFVDADGDKLKMKLRSSTNAEDLADFNGAGLYSSKSYKPNKDGEEKSEKEKLKSLEKAVREVWSSVWNLRAFEERDSFSIPHDQVYMGIQVNPSFSNEEVDGVLVTKNILEREDLAGPGVYIEAQRGDEHSVANPLPGVEAEKILVLYDETRPFDRSAYEIHVLARSNVADDMETLLPQGNPNPVMEDGEIMDLVYQSLKAVTHFSPIFSSEGGKPLILDVEFKVDDLGTKARQVYLKQARPFIE